MTTLTISIKSDTAFKDELRAALLGNALEDSLSFDSYETFAKTITANRLQMLHVLINAEKGMTVRALAVNQRPKVTSYQR